LLSLVDLSQIYQSEIKFGELTHTHTIE
jgi:hypothetical protein